MTLIETLVAMAILSLTIGGLLGATMAGSRTSGASNVNARMNVLFTAFSESIKSVPYVKCASASDYQSAFEDVELRNEEAQRLRQRADTELEVVSVDPCDVEDTGVQTITLRVAMAGREREGVMVKRTPELRDLPLRVDFDLAWRSAHLTDGAGNVTTSLDVQIVWGLVPRVRSSNGVALYEWWCEQRGPAGEVLEESEWADTEQPPSRPPDFVTYESFDPTPECRYLAPAAGTPEADRTVRIGLRATDGTGMVTRYRQRSFLLPPTSVPHTPPIAAIRVVAPVVDGCVEAVPCTNAQRTVSFESVGSVAPAASIVQWTWDFGDGSPRLFCSNLNCRNPTHTYQGGSPVGGFPVSLTVTDSLGATSSTTIRPVYMDGTPVELPLVEISPGSFTGVSPRRVTFTGTASSSHGITLYQWDLGTGSCGADGSGTRSGASLTTVSCSYPQSTGVLTLTVRLTVTDGIGITNQAVVVITLNPVSPPTGGTGGGGGTAGAIRQTTPASENLVGRPYIWLIQSERRPFFHFTWPRFEAGPGDTVVYDVRIRNKDALFGQFTCPLDYDGYVFSNVNTWPLGSGDTLKARIEFPAWNSMVHHLNWLLCRNSYDFQVRTRVINSLTGPNGLASEWSPGQDLRTNY